MDSLIPLQYLRKLRILDNPITTRTYFRLRVIYRLSNLLYLNDVVVSPNERVKAMNLHGDDVNIRIENHNKYTPNLEFKNYQKPFVDEQDDTYPLYEDLEEFESKKAVKLFARFVIKKCFDDTISLLKKVSYQTCNSVN